MREFTFAITYECGADPLADEFIEQLEFAADAMTVLLGAGTFCRIERFAGPRSALDAVERLRTDPTSAGEPVVTSACDATGAYRVVEREPDRRSSTPTSRVSRAVPPSTRSPGRTSTPGCCSRAGGKVTDASGGCSSARTTTSGCSTTRSPAGSGTGCRSGPATSGTPSRGVAARSRGPNSPANSEWPSASRSVGATTKTLREISLEELAAELEVPRSTLSYRLRRAEARVVGSYAGTTLAG